MHTLQRTTPRMHDRRRERGAALIIVMGLIALISTWAVTSAYEDMLAMRRAENSQDGMRAEQASQSVLVLSAKILRDDAKDSQTDDLDEAWAQQSDAFPIDDGSASGRIIDANRFINLNTLVDRNGKVVPAIEKEVKSLFIYLELDVVLVDALIDWMDRDDRPHGSGGAEDSSYYDKDYRVKNAWLDRWEELRLIRGFDGKVVNRLANVAVIMDVPVIGFSTVNINTAGVNVLMALMPEMTPVDAETFVSERPFGNVQQALQNRVWATGINQAHLSVSSDTFMVRTEARFGRVVLREEFMLRREPTKITILSSQRAGRAPVVQTIKKDGLL